MIVQKELVAIYDYEVPVPEDPFSFRLEIHKCSELFTGSVYRLERFRLHPTFHQRDREDEMLDVAGIAPVDRRNL